MGGAHIAPQGMEPLVRIVDLRVAVVSEAGPAHPKHWQIVPEDGPHHGRGDVRGVRNSCRRCELSAQRGRSMVFEHDQPPIRETLTLTAGTSMRRRPRRPGKSISKGL